MAFSHIHWEFYVCTETRHALNFAQTAAERSIRLWIVSISNLLQDPHFPEETLAHHPQRLHTSQSLSQ